MRSDAAFDEACFVRAIERLPRWMLVIAIAGAAAAGATGGVSRASGFLLGAIASYWNFLLLKRIAGGMSGGQPGRRFLFTFLVYVFRIALAAAAGFVILRYSDLSLPAALAGLFVPVAAAIAEILFELGFSRQT